MIWGGFEGFGPCLGISHPTNTHLGKLSPKKNGFIFGGSPYNASVSSGSFVPSVSPASLLHICDIVFAIGNIALSCPIWHKQGWTQWVLIANCIVPSPGAAPSHCPWHQVINKHLWLENVESHRHCPRLLCLSDSLPGGLFAFLYIKRPPRLIHPLPLLSCPYMPSWLPPV